MKLVVLFLASHRRQSRFLQIALLLIVFALLALGASFGLPPALPLLVLGLWAIIASYDMFVFPGFRGVLRQVAGVVFLFAGVFALVMSFRLMIG